MIPPANVIDSLEGGVIVLDPEQRVVVWNRWMAAKSGIATGSAIGAGLTDLFPSLVGSHLLGAVERALRNRLSTVMSHNLHRRVLPLYNGSGPDRESVEQSVVVRPLLEHGYTACLIQVTDITSAVKRDRHLRQLTLYNRALFENAMDPMVTMGLDGRLQDVNAAFAALTGLDRAGLAGRTVQDVLDNPARMQELLASLAADGKVSDFLVSLGSDDGKSRHLSMNAALVPGSEGEGAVYLVARDLTDRIEAQRELEQKSQIIERSNAELAEFAYVVSHDLRQPLRMVSSFLTLIERRLGATLDEEIKGFIDFAVNGAKRMDQLILDLLTYSRIGRLGPSFELVGLDGLVTEAMENLRPAIEESRATIRVQNGLPNYFGSRSELLRLFQNLLDNAIKYAVPGRTPQIGVGWRDNGKSWVLWVRDNGVGIPADSRQRIFGLFQRLVTEQQKEGTGIGLAVCRKIVDHHNGRLWVESLPEEGSTFFIELPKTGLPAA